MDIAVCDDEIEICDEIAELLQGKEGVGRIDSFTSADDLLSATPLYDLIFLDIKLPGTDGVEAARAIREKRQEVSIVFVTGVRECVFDAFDVGALHYLLKPIDRKKLFLVYDMAVKKYNSIDRGEDEKLVIRTRKFTEVVEKKNILYAESLLKKLVIHTGEKDIVYYGNIGELERILGDGFYRCHRGYIVNMAYIKSYNGESVTLKNDESVYLAKERYADFVRGYLKYLKKEGAYFV